MVRKYKTPNTRMNRRIQADYLIKYQVKRGGETLITNVKDIGTGGLQFVAREDLPLLANLTLNVMVPPLGKTVEAKARIIRCTRGPRGKKSYQIAVKFTDIAKRDREALDGFIHHLAEDPDANVEINHADLFVRKKRRS